MTLTWQEQKQLDRAKRRDEHEELLAMLHAQTEACLRLEQAAKWALEALRALKAERAA